MIKEISVQELEELIKKDPNGEKHCVIDVRRADEYNYCKLNTAKLIPMPEIPERVAEIPRDKTVIVHCHHGGRSRKVVTWLQETHGFTNLMNLEGGIHAWSCEIDTAVPTY